MSEIQLKADKLTEEVNEKWITNRGDTNISNYGHDYGVVIGLSETLNLAEKTALAFSLECLIALGLSFSLKISGSMGVTVGGHLQVDALSNKVRGYSTTAEASKTQISGISSSIEGVKTDLETAKNQLTAVDSKIAAALSTAIATENQATAAKMKAIASNTEALANSVRAVASAVTAAAQETKTLGSETVMTGVNTHLGTMKTTLAGLVNIV